MQNVTIIQIKKNRRNLLLLLGVFVLPVAISMSMYFGGWRPTSTANHGDLIQPAKNIEDRNLQSLDGTRVKFSDLHGKWTMVYFDSAACAENCISRLYFMRQIHRSQGKYLDSIQRVFVLSDDKSISTLKSKLSDYPQMKILTAEKNELTKLLHDFGIDTSKDIGLQNIFLLDPLGNLMMKFNSSVEPAGMRKDLERLLKYSAESK